MTGTTNTAVSAAGRGRARNNSGPPDGATSKAGGGSITATIFDSQPPEKETEYEYEGPEPAAPKSP